MAAHAIYDLSGPSKAVPAAQLAGPNPDPGTDSAAQDRASQPGPPAKFGPASVRVAGHSQVHPGHRSAAAPAGPFLASAPRQLAALQAFPHAADSAEARRRQAAHAANRRVELRQCEDLFFSFTFQELIRRSEFLILENTEHGDAYAYRCFARMAEIQQGIIGEEEYDLVHQLRDYFSACEKPLATEGATVCRLFLKLVFGELVKRIASAQPGLKFALEKKEPLCGGAFAILVGDFGKARRLFDAASLDPASRSYALAGIGLLKVLHSDVAGASDAFAGAGIADEDVVKISGLLKY